MKRSLFLILLVVALSLSGTAISAQDKPTEIRFATLQGPPVEPVATMLIEQFNKMHPDITVKVEYLTGDLGTVLATQAAAGTLPDITFTADLFVVPWAKGGIAVDMEPLAKADTSFDLTDVYENMLDLSRVDGKGIYMIPSSYDVVTMYYNKTLFEQAGAPLPTAESTWEEIVASCQMIRQKTQAYCLTNTGWNWWAWYVPWIVGYGGKILSDDGKTVLLSSPETLAGLEAYTDLWKKYDIAQPKDFDAGGDCFNVGKCAIQLHIPGIMPGIRALDPQPFEWDVQVIPTLPKGKFTGMGTYGFTITTNAKSPEIAWDFVKTLLSKDTQKAIVMNYSGMPLLKSLRDDPDIAALTPPPANILAFLENGKNGITPTYFPGDCGSLYAGQINSEINDAMEAAITGAASVEEAFTAANDNIQDCLNKSN